MTYRELQAALKAFRTQGLDVQVKLNASFDTLQAEYNRLSATTHDSYEVAVEPTQPVQTGFESPESLQGRTLAISTNDSPEQPEQVMTTDSFNEWVGLPTDVVEVPGWQKAIADQDDVGLEAICMTNDRMRVTASSKTAKALYSKNSSLFALNASAKLIVNLAIAKDDQGNETATKQQLKPLETLPNRDITPQLRGNIQQTSKQLHNSPKALIHEEIGRLPKVSSRVDLTYYNSLPKNETFSHQENSQSFV